MRRNAKKRLPPWLHGFHPVCADNLSCTGKRQTTQNSSLAPLTFFSFGPSPRRIAIRSERRDGEHLVALVAEDVFAVQVDGQARRAGRRGESAPAGVEEQQPESGFRRV